MVETSERYFVKILFLDEIIRIVSLEIDLEIFMQFLFLFIYYQKCPRFFLQSIVRSILLVSIRVNKKKIILLKPQRLSNFKQMFENRNQGFIFLNDRCSQFNQHLPWAPITASEFPSERKTNVMRVGILKILLKTEK